MATGHEQDFLGKHCAVDTRRGLVVTLYQAHSALSRATVVLCSDLMPSWEGSCLVPMSRDRASPRVHSRIVTCRHTRAMSKHFVVRAVLLDLELEIYPPPRRAPAMAARVRGLGDAAHLRIRLRCVYQMIAEGSRVFTMADLRRSR